MEVSGCRLASEPIAQLGEVKVLSPIEIVWSQPDWNKFLPAGSAEFSTDQQKISYVRALALENVTRATGDNSAAAVFLDGRLVGLGVDTYGASCLQTPIAMAIASAEQHVGTYDLSAQGYELVSTRVPGLYEFGVIWWAGVSRVLFWQEKGGNVQTVSNMSALPSDWKELLASGRVQSGLNPITAVNLFDEEYARVADNHSDDTEFCQMTGVCLAEPQFKVPEWLDQLHEGKMFVGPYDTEDKRAQAAVLLALRNVEYKSGGPFGACIFDVKSNRLIATGVNTVGPFNCSLFHAEILAMERAKQILGVYKLGSRGAPPTVLVTSGAPCVQCQGALLLEGIPHVRFVSTSEEIERVAGFKEGPTLGLESFASYLEVATIFGQVSYCRVLNSNVTQSGLRPLEAYAQMVSDGRVPLYNAGNQK